MWKLAGLGGALAVTGAVKFTNELNELGRQATLQDYLALRCGGGGAPLHTAGSEASDIMALAALHCWGCYAMAAGVALLGFALWRAARPLLQPSRRK